MADETLTAKNGIRAGTISYGQAGSTVNGYLARPDDGRPHPGVIVIQEWWGIEPHIMDLAERVARAGFVALAPDLYHGTVAHEPDEAGKAMMALNMDSAVQEIGHAIEYLRGRADVQPKALGVVGFCMGGMLAWRVAMREGDKVAAVAPFYPAGFQPTPEDMRSVSAAVLAIWGDKDEWNPPEARDQVNGLIAREHHAPHKVLTYPAGHAFMNDQHPTHDPSSARQAWQELVTWLKQHVG